MALTADEDITTNQVTEEEKKPDEGEVSEEQLEDVAGGGVVPERCETLGAQDLEVPAQEYEVPVTYE